METFFHFHIKHTNFYHKSKLLLFAYTKQVYDWVFVLAANYVGNNVTEQKDFFIFL